MECGPTGSFVHRILQARILEWVALPSSRGSSWPRDQTHISCIAGWFFTCWATWQVPSYCGRNYYFLLRFLVLFFFFFSQVTCGYWVTFFGQQNMSPNEVYHSSTEAFKNWYALSLAVEARGIMAVLQEQSSLWCSASTLKTVPWRAAQTHRVLSVNKKLTYDGLGYWDLVAGGWGGQDLLA